MHLEGGAFALRNWCHGQPLEVHCGEFNCQGGDEAKFKEINEAYDILRDPEKRDVYDRVPPSPLSYHHHILSHPNTPHTFSAPHLHGPSSALLRSPYQIFESYNTVGFCDYHLVRGDAVFEHQGYWNLPPYLRFVSSPATDATQTTYTYNLYTFLYARQGCICYSSIGAVAVG